ncbi:MAG: ABC transporter permease subunit, partial [Trichodesmium sp. St11_bin5]|nr:ABC transporter permease subunit [Trichodesmium sp. St11_bin5]
MPSLITKNNLQKLIQKKSQNRILNKLFSIDIIAPVILGIIVLLTWEISVEKMNIPPYLLPGPILVIKTMIQEWNALFMSLITTIKITVVALVVAVSSGVLISILFAQNKLIERSLFPYAVILQTTPIVAISPLIIIWLRDNTFGALILCAWIVAFFPIISNTTLGLNSVDKNLSDMFKLYGASPWQTLIYLRFPSALPYF